MTIKENTKKILNELIKKDGASNRLIEDYQMANSEGVFGYHISKIRKIKNGFSFEHHFASDWDSKYNWTVREKITKEKGYWNYTTNRIINK